MATPAKGVGKGGNSGGRNDPPGGRPRGAVNKRTQVMIAEAARTGQLPLDFLLDVMRDEQAEPRARLYAASAALPYTAAKLYALRTFPDPGTLGDTELQVQLAHMERQDAEISEGERAAAIEDQFDRTLQDIEQLSVRRQGQFLGRLIAAAESGLRRLDEMPDPPGTVVPRKPRQAPAPEAVDTAADAAPAHAAEERWHYDPATRSLKPWPLPR
jgi:hypothetical protein